MTGQSRRMWLPGLMALALLVLGVNSTSALAVSERGHVFGSEFGSPGSAAGQLDEPEGIAVNETTGDVYIADKGNSRVDEFTATGVFVAAWGFGVENGEEKYETCTTTTTCQAGIQGTKEGQLYEPRRITVDNACATEAGNPAACKAKDPSADDVYVETGEYRSQVIDKFTATGTLLTQIRGPPAPAHGAFTGGIEGIATDTTGRLFALELPNNITGEQQGVDSYSNAAVNEFTKFVEARVKGGAFDERGFAVDAEDDFYIREAEEGIAEFDVQGGLLTAAVGGLGEVGFNGVAVESSSGDVYIRAGEGVQRLGAFEVASGGNPPIEELGSGHLPSSGCTGELADVVCLGGVVVDSRSGVVFVVVGGSGRVQEYVPEPPGAPSVRGASVSEVTAGTVVLAGEVNPRSEPGETGTSYWFEYVSEEQFAREGFTGAVRAPEPGGQVAAAYEWGAVGVKLTGLPAGVTYRYRLAAENPYSGGVATVGEARSFTTQPLGGFGLLDGRVWELVSPPDKQGALLEPREKLPYLTVQAAAGGGAVTYYASSPTETGAAGNPGFTQVLSWRGPGGWQSRDLVVPHERATAVTEHPELPLFSEDLSSVVVQPLGPFDPALSPLASEQTAYLYSSFQPPGSSDPCMTGCYAPLVTAANTPEGTRFGVSEGGPPNKSEECPPDPFCGPQFEAASPDLRHIVVRSRAALTGETGGLFEWSEGALTFLGEGETGDGRSATVANFISVGPHAVSVDGSRVVIKGEADGMKGLLLRDTVTGETVKLGGPEAIFVAASSTDSRIFYTNEGGGPLEECETVEEPGDLSCVSFDVSGGAGVLAPVPGASEDGSVVYFVSRGVVPGAEPAPGGEVPVGGQPNLYVSAGGVVRLVAVLSEADASDWGNEEFLTAKSKVKSTGTAMASLSARVSPDGGWLAFESTRRLTGYDNTDAVSGRPDPEVFLYHLAVGGGVGSVVCVSCDGSGARPRGGAGVPGWTTSLYQSRYLSDGGRLFFESPDQLVPQDTNNAEDVYEFEPPAGEGSPSGDSCSRLSLTYVPASEGCVDLVSSGSSPEPSSFLDASENGDEVFFLTAAKLSTRDVDTAFDVYDARVGGSEPEPEKTVECQGDACQAPVSPPESVTPGSLSFSGPGNLTPPPVVVVKTAAQIRAERLAKALMVCRKKKNKHKRLACEKQARKKYAAKKASRPAKKASRGRAARASAKGSQAR